MRNSFDFSSWQAVVSTLFGIVAVTLVAVGVRLVLMQSLQQRRERHNRQINERLKTLIAAYKTLGGSFTGDLAVDPSHLWELRKNAVLAQAALEQAEGQARAEGQAGTASPPAARPAASESGSDRRRRIRDAVEAALSDVILLGTQEQVRLAAQAASDMVAGRSIETAALVVSLRTFIREVLDLEVIPGDLPVPKQGPVRANGSGGRGGGGGGGGSGKSGGGGGGGGGGGSDSGAGTGAAAGTAGGLGGFSVAHESRGSDALRVAVSPEPAPYRCGPLKYSLRSG